MVRSKVRHRFKIEADTTIAKDLGVPVLHVAKITAAFIEELVKCISTHKSVTVTGLGKFSVSVTEGRKRKSLCLGGDYWGPKTIQMVAVPQSIKVHFAKSLPLTQALAEVLEESTMDHTNEEGMSKFGVDENVDQETLEKQAASGCPVDGCGRAPERHGRTLICPVHGSEPFE
jgi:nucleoid DNA-binding protein